MIRYLAFILFFLGFIAARAQSDEGTYAQLDLISEVETIVPGEVFHLAVHFEIDPHWHIYWKNPGASGLAPEITWDLPEGFNAGDIQFPTPERIEMAGLMSYAYEDIATLIVPIQAPGSLTVGDSVQIKADVFYLICKDVCLPGEASLEVELKVAESSVLSAHAAKFTAARASQPSAEAPFLVSISAVDEVMMDVEISPFPLSNAAPIPSELYFYPEEEGYIDVNAAQLYTAESGVGRLELRLDYAYFEAESPVFRGILQSSDASWNVQIGVEASSQVLAESELSVSQFNQGGFEQSLLDMGLAGWLVLAFLGGLILNIMPCVLPVLSIKVFSLLNQGMHNRARSMAHGGAYSLGVVVSFLVLAGVLFGLRAVGESVGWGFQLQDPGFVLVLALVFLLFALNLLGVFEFGTSLVGADVKVAGRKDLLGSFGVGVLAAVVGAPCVGPLVGGVSGVALQTSTATGLAIFGMMGLGMASPFIVLAAFPKLVAYLPRPGNWMVTFKQLMGFLLIASVVFLIYLMGQLAGLDGVTATLITLLLASFASWIFGTWAAPHRSSRSKWISRILALAILAGVIGYGIPSVKEAYADNIALPDESSSGLWKPWSAEAVQAAMGEGRPVFVDFTATWCLICQVNKKAALRTDSTTALFDAYNVATFSADWTRYDEAITQELERYGRSGVPLYLLFRPDREVRVLPQNLTNGIMKDAVESFLAE